MKHHITTYFRESSIHGLLYLVDKNLHWVEKLFWTLMIIVSGICCGALIFKIGVKVQEDTTVTYASDSPIGIKKVPFPAVTFCPDLLTHNGAFDYNRIVKQLKTNEITIENVTQTEQVNFEFDRSLK